MVYHTTCYWIYDEDHTPRGFPLNRLITLIEKHFSSKKTELRITRASGYGLKINEWDAELDTADSILTDFATVKTLGEGVEEWFYELNAVCTSGSLIIKFGLHDSSALYFGAPATIANEIIRNFTNFKEAPAIP